MLQMLLIFWFTLSVAAFSIYVALCYFQEKFVILDGRFWNLFHEGKWCFLPICVICFFSMLKFFFSHFLLLLCFLLFKDFKSCWREDRRLFLENKTKFSTKKMKKVSFLLFLHCFCLILIIFVLRANPF